MVKGWSCKREIRKGKKDRQKFVKIKKEGKSKCDDRINTEMERKYKNKVKKKKITCRNRSEPTSLKDLKK